MKVKFTLTSQLLIHSSSVLHDFTHPNEYNAFVWNAERIHRLRGFYEAT